MNFFIGEKVRNTMRDRDGIIAEVLSDDFVFVNYVGIATPQKTSVSNLTLLSKRSSFKQVLASNPAALQEFAGRAKDAGVRCRIEVHCGKGHTEETAEDISANSSLSPTAALDFINETAQDYSSHGFTICMPEELMPKELIVSLGRIFWTNYKTGAETREPVGHRAKKGEVQINSADLARWLMREYNILPIRFAQPEQA
jgi:hypothetical protein